jgi:predicted nucleic acid-binding protein
VKEPPRRLFLDTNVFIVGAAFEHSPEAVILDWAGFASPRKADVVILVSGALFRQISRVAQRLRDKDWGGEIIARIWRNMTVDFVLLDEAEIRRWETAGAVPREDVTVYLTALRGGADCFVSANHELVRVLAQQSDSFVCLTPAQFVEAYLAQSG